MPPIEGERSFNNQFANKLDSTEPGTGQPFDLPSSIIRVECDEDDKYGTAQVLNPNHHIQLFTVYPNSNRALLYGGYNLAKFSGEARVEVVYELPDSNLKEVLTFWHHTGEAEQPPYRSERVPLSPAPPPEEKAVELVPEQERELVTAVSK